MKDRFLIYSPVEQGERSSFCTYSLDSSFHFVSFRMTSVIYIFFDLLEVYGEIKNSTF